MNALALEIDQFEFTDIIGDAIKRVVERSPSGIKEIARATNANTRTVENWAQKKSAPDGLHLVRLMATVPEIQVEVRRLASMQADLDPEFERDLNTLMRTYWRLQDRT